MKQTNDDWHLTNHFSHEMANYPRETRTEKVERRKNMANRMRKFTGVREQYDPKKNMKKFQH